MSPDASFQSHSLPSSVTDTLEAMVGGGLDDLTLEDIDSTNLTEEQQQTTEVCVMDWFLSYKHTPAFSDQRGFFKYNVPAAVLLFHQYLYVHLIHMYMHAACGIHTYPIVHQEQFGSFPLICTCLSF